MIDIRDCDHSYGSLVILRGISCTVPRGSFATICGGSGSGKSTLLLIIGGLLRPDRGTVRVGDQEVTALDERARNTFRARTLGFVFQRFHLLPYLSVADNVRLAGAAAGSDDAAGLDALLDELALAGRRHHTPEQLSVGEQQRCALARAIYARPAVLLADEPTGNLDPDNAARILTAFRRFADDGGTVLMVSHDPQAAARADCCWHLAGGRLERESPQSPRTTVGR